jgi:hypothetical protein
MRLQGSGQRSAERACCAPICMRKDWVSGQAGEGGTTTGQGVPLCRSATRRLVRGLHGMASASSAPPTPTSAAAAADQQRYENPINLKGTPLLRVCQPVG